MSTKQYQPPTFWEASWFERVVGTGLYAANALGMLYVPDPRGASECYQAMEKEESIVALQNEFVLVQNEDEKTYTNDLYESFTEI